VNNLLRDDLPSDWFVTMVVAVAHESEGRVDLFSAGHGPNFVYHSEDGRLETFSADTPPLGVLPELPPATGRSFTLQPGGLLVLASDGFHEWPRDDGARFGVERLQNAIVSRAEQAPAECIAGILAEVETFAGSSAQPDDMSMMVLKRF
jgi:serine phosphatase RsbU (regulator of sigma subunit)